MKSILAVSSARLSGLSARIAFRIGSLSSRSEWCDEGIKFVVIGRDFARKLLQSCPVTESKAR